MEWEFISDTYVETNFCSSWLIFWIGHLVFVPWSVRFCQNFCHVGQFPYLIVPRVVINHRKAAAAREGSSPSSCVDFYVAEVGTFARMNGSAEQMYQPRLRRLYDRIKNTGNNNRQRWQWQRSHAATTLGRRSTIQQTYQPSDWSSYCLLDRSVSPEAIWCPRLLAHHFLANGAITAAPSTQHPSTHAARTTWHFHRNANNTTIVQVSLYIDNHKNIIGPTLWIYLLQYWWTYSLTDSFVLGIAWRIHRRLIASNLVPLAGGRFTLLERPTSDDPNIFGCDWNTTCWRNHWSYSLNLLVVLLLVDVFIDDSLLPIWCRWLVVDLLFWNDRLPTTQTFFGCDWNTICWRNRSLELQFEFIGRAAAIGWRIHRRLPSFNIQFGGLALAGGRSTPLEINNLPNQRFFEVACLVLWHRGPSEAFLFP